MQCICFLAASTTQALLRSLLTSSPQKWVSVVPFFFFLALGGVRLFVSKVFLQASFTVKGYYFPEPPR
jgi:hypothetical protein